MESKYFETQELVDQEVYDLLGDNAIKLIDPKLIETLDKIREIFDAPLICNNGHWGGTRDQCGYRSAKCNIGAPKSYHKRGQAVDLISTRLSAEDMRSILEQKQNDLPHPIRIEKGDNYGEISGLHVDLGDTKGNKIYFFKA